MGDNVVEAQVREIVTRFQGDFQRVLELLQGEHEQMQARIRELEEQLVKEREQRQCAEEHAEEHRRLAQKLYAQLHPPTQEDIDWWRNVNLAEFTIPFEDVLAEIENMPE